MFKKNYLTCLHLSEQRKTDAITYALLSKILLINFDEFQVDTCQVISCSNAHRELLRSDSSIGFTEMLT